MKTISKIILGLIFAVGVISISNAKTARISIDYNVDCYEAYTVCDNFTKARAAEFTNPSYEDEYAFFAECMNANGC